MGFSFVYQGLANSDPYYLGVLRDTGLAERKLLYIITDKFLNAVCNNSCVREAG
jgi:hypothetical protein